MQQGMCTGSICTEKGHMTHPGSRIRLHPTCCAFLSRVAALLAVAWGRRRHDADLGALGAAGPWVGHCRRTWLHARGVLCHSYSTPLSDDHIQVTTTRPFKVGERQNPVLCVWQSSGNGAVDKERQWT